MVSLFIGLLVLGCGAYLYQKGTLVISFAAIIAAVCAFAVAFNYFELLANVLISRELIIEWAQPVCFILLFVLAFALLMTIVMQITKEPIEVGVWPDRIARAICGLIVGFIISGVLLITLAMAPIPNKFPYPRFDKDNPRTEFPTETAANPDGFVTGCFNLLSKGCLSGKRSFAVLHPDFIDQNFLNRHLIEKDIPILTSSPVIKVPGKKATRIITEPLKDAKPPNKPIEPPSGHKLTALRMGIMKKSAKEAGTFTLSQVRLICKPKTQLEHPLTGNNAINVYPIGFLQEEGLLELKKLIEPIRLKPADFPESIMWIDFVFRVPEDFAGILVEFKQNNLATVYP